MKILISSILIAISLSACCGDGYYIVDDTGRFWNAYHVYKRNCFHDTLLGSSNTHEDALKLIEKYKKHPYKIIEAK